MLGDASYPVYGFLVEVSCDLQCCHLKGCSRRDGRQTDSDKRLRDGVGTCGRPFRKFDQNTSLLSEIPGDTTSIRCSVRLDKEYWHKIHKCDTTKFSGSENAP